MTLLAQKQVQAPAFEAQNVRPEREFEARRHTCANASPRRRHTASWWRTSRGRCTRDCCASKSCVPLSLAAASLGRCLKVGVGRDVFMLRLVQERTICTREEGRCQTAISWCELLFGCSHQRLRAADCGFSRRPPSWPSSTTPTLVRAPLPHSPLPPLVSFSHGQSSSLACVWSPKPSPR